MSIILLNSVDDCFGDMEEPLYGFIVEVTVSENQTCQILPSSDDNDIPQCQLLSDDSENENEINSGMFKRHCNLHALGNP